MAQRSPASREAACADVFSHQHTGGIAAILFSGLLSLDCDSILCSTWRPKSSAAARKEIVQQEKFSEFFKVGVFERVMSGKNVASLDTTVGAKAATSNFDDLSEVIRSLDKKAQGEYSLRLLLAAKTADQLRDTVPCVHRIFVDSRAQVMEETLGNLSGFYAMFPGNHRSNVFPLWLGEVRSWEPDALIGAEVRRLHLHIRYRQQL